MELPLALVDQIAGDVIIPDYEKWKELVYKRTGKEFGDTYGDVTGTLLYDVETDKYSSRSSSFNYKGFELKLIKKENKHTSKKENILRIKANPSAIYFNGKNYRNIPFDAFKKMLTEFAATFDLDLRYIRITAPFEPSITVVSNMDYIILNEDSLKNRLILYQGRKQEIMTNNHGRFMGYTANNSHYYTKIYLPSTKFADPLLNSLRVELHYNRIKTFTKRTGIHTWAHLITEEAMYACYELVLRAWDDTIVHDLKLRKSKNYEDHINEMIKNGGYADYWINDYTQKATDKTLKEWIQKYRELSSMKGEGLHSKIRNWMVNEGMKFRKVTTWLTGNISEFKSKDKIANSNNDFNSNININMNKNYQNIESFTKQVIEIKETANKAVKHISIRMVMSRAKKSEIKGKLRRMELLALAV